MVFCRDPRGENIAGGFIWSLRKQTSNRAIGKNSAYIPSGPKNPPLGEDESRPGKVYGVRPVR
jgi:hypothetical protein